MTLTDITASVMVVTFFPSAVGDQETLATYNVSLATFNEVHSSVYLLIE